MSETYTESTEERIDRLEEAIYDYQVDVEKLKDLAIDIISEIHRLTKAVEANKPRYCAECGGNGKAPSSMSGPCPACNGKGF